MLSVDPTLGSPREQRFVGRKEFEEFTIGVVRQQEFEEFKQQVNSKLDSILHALAKGRPVVETLRGPQIESGPTVEAEIQGFQAANSTETLPSLDDQEQFGKEVEYEGNHVKFLFQKQPWPWDDPSFDHFQTLQTTQSSLAPKEEGWKLTRKLQVKRTHL